VRAPSWSTRGRRMPAPTFWSSSPARDRRSRILRSNRAENPLFLPRFSRRTPARLVPGGGLDDRVVARLLDQRPGDPDACSAAAKSSAGWVQSCSLMFEHIRCIVMQRALRPSVTFSTAAGRRRCARRYQKSARHLPWHAAPAHRRPGSDASRHRPADGGASTVNRRRRTPSVGPRAVAAVRSRVSRRRRTHPATGGHPAAGAGAPSELVRASPRARAVPPTLRRRLYSSRPAARAASTSAVAARDQERRQLLVTARPGELRPVSIQKSRIVSAARGKPVRSQRLAPITASSISRSAPAALEPVHEQPRLVAPARRHNPASVHSSRPSSSARDSAKIGYHVVIVLGPRAGKSPVTTGEPSPTKKRISSARI